MPRNVLIGDTKLQFSGHDTFPLRYGWLKKVFDAVRACELQGIDTKSVFSAQDAIARFGVGKNMVTAMRYWALAAGIIEAESLRLGPYKTTKIGRALLNDEGFDPWMEDPTSLWLLHWRFAATPERTSTWFWVFNHCPYGNFDRPLIEQSLVRWCEDNDQKVAAPTTLKRDVDCFVSTYVEKPGPESREDTLESPLTELSLIRTISRKDGFQFARGPKPTLNLGMFAFAIAEFWRNSHAGAGTLSFEVLQHGAGSPGRVFVLDEESLVDFATELEATTNGAFAWSETAGLRQLICRADPKSIDPMPFLLNGYGQLKQKAA